MSQTLLIIGGGVEQVPAYRFAKSRGLTVVGTDANPDAPGLAVADVALMASTRDASGTVAVIREFAATHRVDGVMTLANDVPFTVASVAHALGLPGISLEAAGLASHKLRMKERFQAAGVACPWFQAIHTAADLARLMHAQPEQTLVLKPVDGRGARGVLRLTPDIDPGWAFEESRRWGDSGQIMVEAFVPGVQLSTESFFVAGRCHTAAVSERNYAYLERFSPFIIEDGGTVPALLSDRQREAIDDLLTRGAQAMGIFDGVIKGDLVIDARTGMPMIIELAARLSGGWFATHQIPQATGIHLMDAVIRHALGEPVPVEILTPRFQWACAIRYWFAPPGRITAMTGTDRLPELPGVVQHGFFRGVGDMQPPICSHPDRLGYVMATADDRETAIRQAQEAIQSVHVTVEPCRVSMS